MPHRVHTHPTRLDRESAVAITIDADVVGTLLEDAAHFPVPGGHAPAVAYPRSEGDVAALGQDARSMLPVGALVLGRRQTAPVSPDAADHTGDAQSVLSRRQRFAIPPGDLARPGLGCLIVRLSKARCVRGLARLLVYWKL